jgi:hypothetical protein
MPDFLLEGQPKRETLKEKMQPGWEPPIEQVQSLG